MNRVVVIGGGVAGCAAAVAAAEAGAAVTLVERLRHLGGVAAQGEHRTICGLAAIDAQHADLLEPELTAEWVAALTTGAPQRRGRVWLWPTDAERMQRGLRQRLDGAGVTLSQGHDVTTVEVEHGNIRSIAGLPCTSVIDAAGAVAKQLGISVRAPSQWASHRSVIALPQVGDGRAVRVRLLATIQRALGPAAAAVEPLGDGRWQMSLDLPPGSTSATASGLAERAAAALGGQLLSCATRVAERDQDRPAGGLSLDALFACRERGLCWAAWPREEHGPEGVLWQWPDHDRHGVPVAAVRLPGSPANLWMIGKGMPVDTAAAAALRVIGTALAIGAAVGAQVGRANNGSTV